MPNIYSGTPPIIAEYDVYALVSAVLQLFYIRKGDGLGHFNNRLLKPWIGEMDPKILKKVCLDNKFDPERLAYSAFGKAALNLNVEPNATYRAFSLILNKPEQLARLCLICDILGAYKINWPFGDQILHKAITPKLVKFNKTKQSCMEKAIRYLNQHEIAPIRDLDSLIGASCKPYLLDLRSIGHQISIGVHLNIAEKKLVSIAYLNKQISFSSPLI